MTVPIKAQCRCVRCGVNFCDPPDACPFCGAIVTAVPDLILREMGSFHAVTVLTDRAQAFLDAPSITIRAIDGLLLIPAERFAAVLAELLDAHFNIEFGKRISCAA